MEEKDKEGKKFQIRGAIVANEKETIIVRDSNKTEWIKLKKKNRAQKKQIDLNLDIKETAQKEDCLDGDEPII